MKGRAACTEVCYITGRWRDWNKSPCSTLCGNKRDLLQTPKTKMGVLVRRLAEIAMSVTHHDASDTEPGYVHEVQLMEQKFTAVLRGKLRAGEKADG